MKRHWFSRWKIVSFIMNHIPELNKWKTSRDGRRLCPAYGPDAALLWLRSGPESRPRGLLYLICTVISQRPGLGREGVPGDSSSRYSQSEIDAIHNTNLESTNCSKSTFRLFTFSFLAFFLSRFFFFSFLLAWDELNRPWWWCTKSDRIMIYGLIV